MKRTWEVEADGVKHKIEYKAGGFGSKVIVDGEIHKVKSANWLINIIDYAISFGEKKCQLVVIGNKADLAVDGVFLSSQEPYAPVSSAPAWTWVLTGISIIGGWFLCGLIGAVIGIVMATRYVQLGIQKKTGAAIGFFIGCSVIQVVLLLVVTGLLA